VRVALGKILNRPKKKKRMGGKKYFFSRDKTKYGVMRTGMLNIDGNYYYIDTTWGDASYVMSGADASYEGKVPQINYEYLCVPDSQLFRTHTVGKIIPLPSCTSMEANYYVREGFFLTEWREEKVEKIFQEEYEKGSAYVTLKCANDEVYRQMQDALIERQEVFNYLDCPDGVISYSDNAEQYSMSFWL